MLKRKTSNARKICMGIFLALAICCIGWAGNTPALGYDLFPLYPQYKGENHDCVWQPFTNCPPYVIYLDYFERQTLKINVRDNKLYNSRGDVFDTSGASPSHTGPPAAIFIMDSSGNLYASNDNTVFLFHHSSIAAGQPVAAAGELMVKNGIIQMSTNCSGHYRPPADKVNSQLSDSLKKQGYARTINFKPCNIAKLKMTLDYKTRQTR